MYESPINLFVSDIATSIDKRIEEVTVNAIQNLGIDINKDELIKALDYDRQQYAKGYKDGLNDATARFIEGERYESKWIPVSDSAWESKFFCFKCGERTKAVVMGKPRYKFCPMCGCKMKGVSE